MKKSLEKGGLRLVVNTMGAYVDQFERDGEPIFFPKLMIKIGDQLKVRGGMHVCAPNFGQDKMTGKLNQHGFCRDNEFSVLEESQEKISLGLDGQGDYEKAYFTISYALEENLLRTSLLVENKGDEDIIIAPGFHPYFYTNDKSIEIRDFDFDEEDLPASIFCKARDRHFVVNGKEMTLRGLENIGEYVLWSDKAGDYVCLEPTYDGNSFEDKDKKVAVLKPKESFRQEFVLELA